MGVLRIKLKQILENVLLLIGSIVFVLITAEIVVRLFSSQSGINNSRGLLENNELLGYSMKPNAEFIHKDKYRKYRVITNSRGLRSPEHPYSKPEGVFRIIILGDLFTYGHGVDNNETFSHLLFKYLNTGSKKFEVINAGVSGYGSWEQLQWLRLEGYKNKPDLIITAFCEDNDALDNYMAVEAKKWGKFRREVIDGKLVEVKFGNRKFNKGALAKSINPTRGFIKRHSHLRELIVERIFSFKVRYGFKSRNKNLPNYFFWINVLKKRYTEMEEESFEITKDILLETSKFIKSIGAQYLIISIPLVESVDKKVFNITIQELELNKDDYDIKKPARILEAFCLSNGVPLIKLSEHLDGSMYFPLNRHFNKVGNKKVAMVLTKYIETYCQ